MPKVTHGVSILLMTLAALGCLGSPETVSHDEFRVTLESLGLSHSVFRDGHVSSAFYSGDDIHFEISNDNNLDLSLLKFTSMSSDRAAELWNQLEKLDLTKYSDGSVCACAFEIDFVVKVEVMNGKTFDLVVDPAHHHVYLFIDGRQKWMGRLTNESWSKLREFVAHTKVNAQ
jgi:hypothetical protein